VLFRSPQNPKTPNAIHSIHEIYSRPKLLYILIYFRDLEFKFIKDKLI
jgi:hypothetical protein